MQIDWNQILKTKEGKDLLTIREEGELAKPVTLKELVCTALDSFTQKRELQPTEKYERYKIIKAINDGVSLNVKEIAAAIKACEEYAFFPFVYGQIMDVLNVAEEKPALEKIDGGKA